MNEYLGALVAMFGFRKRKPKSKEQLDAEMELSNEMHYLSLKKKTEEELKVLNRRLGTNFSIKEATLNGFPLMNLTIKHCKELGLE